MHVRVDTPAFQYMHDPLIDRGIPGASDGKPKVVCSFSVLGQMAFYERTNHLWMRQHHEV